LHWVQKKGEKGLLEGKVYPPLSSSFLRGKRGAESYRLERSKRAHHHEWKEGGREAELFVEGKGKKVENRRRNRGR